jgi:cysteine desulfurase
MKRLRDRMEASLRDSIEDLVVNCSAERIPNTMNVSIPTIDRQAFLMAADLCGLALSAGSACASGSSEPSPVLKAMGLEPAVVSGSIRISLGAATTETEVDEAARRMIKLSKELRRSKRD